MEKVLKKINKEEKPRLLLHSCCGPCSSAILERISDYFDLDIFYYNPNIDSENEFYRRSDEQIKLVEDLELDDKIDVKVIKYNHQEFLSYIKGFEKYEEGGARCFRCYRQRLEKTARYAKENNYDYFTTTLSISPHKDSQILNRLGKFLAEKYKVNYLFSDFKKKNGFKRSVELTDKFNMYRQSYCGCEFSRGEDWKILEIFSLLF